MNCVTVHVSNLCINQGTRGNCKECPIALALKLMFPKENIEVCKDFIYIGHRQYYTPGRAKSFIRNFDLGYTWAAFHFTMYERDPRLP